MRKKKPQRAVNETTAQPLHPIGRERYIPVDVTRYEGDLPSEEPNDWFTQSDEYDGYEIDDKYLWDEW